ncbi:MAG: endoglucanase [Acidobacteriota bacterium]
MRAALARFLHYVSIPFLLLLSATSARAQSAWPLWNAYVPRFIDANGRVIDFKAGDHTTSEGQSYALFFALVANDRPRFDKVLAWTRDNLAAGDMNARLPGWLWGKDKDGKWRLLDAGSASDSDCWIAYDLLEAGRLWYEPAYTRLAQTMIGMIAHNEIADLPGFGTMLMPGAAANWVHNRVWTVNASYLPLFIVERFAEVDPTGPWQALARNIPLFLAASNRRGFVMDWNNYTPAAGFQPAPPPGPPPAPPKPATQPKPAPPARPAPTAESPQPRAAAAPYFVPIAKPQAPAPAKPLPPPPPLGSYDAIRVYLWAGMLDPSTHGRSDMLISLAGMAAYLADHGAPPEKVDADGAPLAQDGPVGFSAAVLPFLRALPRADKAFVQQRDRLNAQLDPATGLYGKDPAYYDQNLTLFATGFLDGRFRFASRGELKVEWTRE